MKKAQRIYPNQNRITFQSTPRNTNNPYGVYNKEALFTAIEELNPCAFKLYLYLGGFQESNPYIYLSKQDALNTTRMSEKSYFAAKKELKEHGYLIKDETSSEKHAYVFIESPHQ